VPEDVCHEEIASKVLLWVWKYLAGVRPEAKLFVKVRDPTPGVREKSPS